MSRIVVSMTTSPRRIRLFRPVMEAVFEQSRLPDQIHLHLPHRFRGETEYQIPDWMLNEVRIAVHRHQKDLGPVMKILPTLEIETDPETMIVTADDDVCLPPDAVEQLSQASVEHPDTAFCSRGFRFDRNANHIAPVRGHLKKCDALQGYSGCIYRRRHFNASRLHKQLESLPPRFLFSDDVLLSNHVAGEEVKRATVEFRTGKLNFMPWSDEDPDALKFIDGSTHARYQMLREHLEAEDDWHLSKATS